MPQFLNAVVMTGAGTVTAPTVATADNSTNVATTAFVKAQSYALDSAVVHLANTETVTGAKTFTGAVTLAATTHTDATDISFGTTTGTRIGTATTQKIGFFSATPIVRPAGDIQAAISALGLVSSPTLAADMLMPLSQATISLTGATTLTSTAFGRMHVCSGTTANYTVTLPNPSGNSGKFILFLMGGALTKLVTISQYDTTGHTDKIDGLNTRVMWANESAWLFCDGTNWTKVAGKSIPMSANLFLGSGSVSLAPGQTPIPTKSILTDNTGLMADTANGRLNILRPSTYLAASFTTVNNSSPGYTGGINAAIMLNAGTAINGGLFYFAGPSYPTATGGGTITAATGDTIQGALYQSTGGTLATVGTAASQNYLSVIEIISW